MSSPQWSAVVLLRSFRSSCLGQDVNNLFNRVLSWLIMLRRGLAVVFAFRLSLVFLLFSFVFLSLRCFHRDSWVGCWLRFVMVNSEASVVHHPRSFFCSLLFSLVFVPSFALTWTPGCFFF